MNVTMRATSARQSSVGIALICHTKASRIAGRAEPVIETNETMMKMVRSKPMSSV
jgi:hypothetical protein